jgi:glycosyltransferase involved in cell wall biosynthesis
MRGGKIAILIPAYNGGTLLLDTVMSAARVGLPSDSYEILVCDNASTDGSVVALPPQDEQGVPITVYRNDTNLGRVANWNCALATSEETGFSYALFLMVGDALTDCAVIALRDRMKRRNAFLGIAPFVIADEALRPVRVARRISWRGDPDAGLPANRFLAQSLAQGAMLFAPLGANLYRIDGKARLRFDTGDDTHADHFATAEFARKSQTPIVYLDRPISLWRRRPGRFHASMTVTGRLTGDVRVMECACRASRQPLDYPRIRASLLLRAIVFCRGNLRRAWCLARDIPQPSPISWTWLAKLIVRLFRHGTPWLVEAR